MTNETVHVNSPTQKVARKVQLATIATYLGTLVIGGVITLLQDGSLIEVLPAPVAPFIVPLVPALITLLAGFTAKNNARDVNSSGQL